LAVMMVPSILNSITACDLLIAADWANASRAAELLFHKDIKIPLKYRDGARLDFAEDEPPRTTIDQYYSPAAGSHRLVKKTLISYNFNDLPSQKLYDNSHTSKMGREHFCECSYR
jgi:hypothetical protein